MSYYYNALEALEERAFSEGYMQRMFDEKAAAEKEAEGFISRNWNRAKKQWGGKGLTNSKWGNRTVMVAVPAAAIGATAYGVHKYRNRGNENEDED